MRDKPWEEIGFVLYWVAVLVIALVEIKRGNS